MSVVTCYTISAGVWSAEIIDIHYNTVIEIFVEQTCHNVSIVTCYTTRIGMWSTGIIDIDHKTVAKAFVEYILNIISCAPHTLLMTAEVNGSQLNRFSFLTYLALIAQYNLQTQMILLHSNIFTISWKLNMGYKTKVITLTPERSTITSNEEKEMIKSAEIRDSSKTYSSRLKKLFFRENLCFWVIMRFLKCLKVKLKNPKFHSKAILLVRK